MSYQSQSLGIKAQIELLRHCIKEGTGLEEELTKLGLNYDALVYRSSNQNCSLELNLNSRTESLDDITKEGRDIPIVSFFSGAGGLDLGFESQGFRHLGAIEINELFCDTLRLNRPHWTILGPPMHSGDIRNKDEYSHLLRQGLGITVPFEGVFIGGPPCQPFSIAANQRFSKSDDNFKRVGFDHVDYGNLLFDYIWYIKHFRPRAFLIENVAGLLSVDDGAQVSKAVTELQSAGYTVTEPTVLNAANFGVPQMRQRVFIVGSRMPDGIRLPSIELASKPCSAVLHKPIEGVSSHVTRLHKAESILRYMELGYGQRDKLGRVDRLNPDEPSKTVIAGGANGGGRSHLHPDIPRTLSVRESARLQTFPDTYAFCGPSARQFTQVGNAVPPLLAAKIAARIYEFAFN